MTVFLEDNVKCFQMKPHFFFRCNFSFVSEWISRLRELELNEKFRFGWYSMDLVV